MMPSNRKDALKSKTYRMKICKDSLSSEIIIIINLLRSLSRTRMKLQKLLNIKVNWFRNWILYSWIQNTNLSEHIFMLLTKQIFGMKVDTYIVNVIVLWVMTFFLYLALYFRLLKKLLDSGEVCYGKKMKDQID